MRELPLFRIGVMTVRSTPRTFPVGASSRDGLGIRRCLCSLAEYRQLLRLAILIRSRQVEQQILAPEVHASQRPSGSPLEAFYRGPLTVLYRQAASGRS